MVAQRDSAHVGIATTPTPANEQSDICKCDARMSRRKYIQFDLQHFSINHAFRTIAARFACAAADAVASRRCQQHCSRAYMLTPICR